MPPTAGPALGLALATPALDGCTVYDKPSLPRMELSTATSTITVPACNAGGMQMTIEDETYFALVPCWSPNQQLSSPTRVKPCPITVTVSPILSARPSEGLSSVIFTPCTYMYCTPLLVKSDPPFMLTSTATAPSVDAGAMQVNSEDESPTAAEAEAMRDPKRHVAPPDLNPLPYTLTIRPPASGPIDGSTILTIGADMYSNAPAPRVYMPSLPCWSLTTTVSPAVPGGAQHLAVFASTTSPSASSSPNWQRIVSPNAMSSSCTTIITVVPPLNDPRVGVDDTIRAPVTAYASRAEPVVTESAKDTVTAPDSLTGTVHVTRVDVM